MIFVFKLYLLHQIRNVWIFLTQVWHPISWSAYEISDCTSECRPYSLLSLDSGVNCSPELLIVLWSGKPGSYIRNTDIHVQSKHELSIHT